MVPSDAIVSVVPGQMPARRAPRTTSELDQADANPASPASTPPKARRDRIAGPGKARLKYAPPPPPTDPVLNALGIQSFIYTARTPFDSTRLYALLQQWKDDISALEQVSLQLGLDATDATVATSDNRDQQRAEAAKRQLAANPDKPPLRFTLNDRVECNVGTWAAGKITYLWYEEPGMAAAAPYQVTTE